MQIFADKKFQNPIKIIKAFDNESFVDAFSEIEKYGKTNYLLGYIRYEAKDFFLGRKIKSKLPLLYFEVFEGYEEFLPESIKPVQKVLLKPEAQIDYKTYAKAIGQIKEEIACGNTYQVNYTYDYKIRTKADGMAVYESVLANQTTPYNSYIKNEWEEIISFSPELFFEIENNKIKTKPMKGTVKRGETEAEDKKNIEFLKNDIKNRAENVMIVDLLRNDLGKIAKTGTVKVDKLFEVETHKTLHQMTSEVTAELEDNTSLYKIFEALFPCGSITGAPKINTMKIIDELEIGQREIYCGAIGLISPEKTVFSVPIRILQKKKQEDFFLCRVGGAIVWDSTAQDEWEETLTKIKFLNPVTNVGWICQPNNNEFKLVETIKVENGKMIYKTAHFNRMKKTAKELGFKFTPFNLKPTNDGILRILLSRDGVFETQYLPLNPISTNTVTISQIKIDSQEPLLYHKTTHRRWYDESLKRIQQGEVYDEIFLNEKGELTEGARSNLVLEIDGKLFTPPVESGILNGVLRQKMIKKLEEKKLYLEDLKKAERIFCINSVRGIVEVKVDFN